MAHLPSVRGIPTTKEPLEANLFAQHLRLEDFQCSRRRRVLVRRAKTAGRPHRYGSLQDIPERGSQDAGANQLDPDFAFVCLLRVEMRGSLSAFRADCFRPLAWHIFGDSGMFFWYGPVAKNRRTLGTIFRAQRVQKRTHFEDQIRAQNRDHACPFGFVLLKGTEIRSLFWDRNMVPKVGPFLATGGTQKGPGNGAHLLYRNLNFL